MLKKVLLSFLILIIIIFFDIDLLSLNLESIITPKLLSKYQKKYIPNLRIDWSKIDISIKNRGFLTKKVNFSSDSQCITYKTSEFCHKELSLIAVVKPLGFPLIDIKKLRLIEQKNKINLSDFSDNEKPNEFTPFHQSLYSLFNDYNISKDLTPDKLKIESSGVVKAESGELKYDSLFSYKNLIFNLIVNDLNLSIENKDEFMLSGDFDNNLEITVKNDLGVFESVIDFKVEDEFFLSDLKFNGDFTDQSVSDLEASTKIKAKLNEDLFELSLTDFKTVYEPYLEDLKINQCEFRATSSAGENISLKCQKNSVTLSAKKFKSDWSKKTVEDFGPFLFGFDIKLDEKTLRTDESGKLALLSYVLDEKVGDFFKLNSDAEFRIDKNKSSYTFEPINVRFDLLVSSFQKLSKILRKSPFAIPAPLNDFGGEMAFKINDLDSTDLKSLKLPFDGYAKLNGSRDAKLNFDLNGHLDLIRSIKKTFKPELFAEIVFQNSLLYLPDFDPLGGVPTLTVDDRIINTSNSKSSVFVNSDEKKTNKPIKKKSSFKYDVKIRTEDQNSFRVKYKLVDPYLPLRFNIRATDENLALKLYSTKNWAVEYLKKRVMITKMNLTQNVVSNEGFDVDANLLYKASDYDIYIRIVGDVTSPAVTLRSDPPLSRSDIISVMIYNRTADDLDRFQTESVGGAEAAFADRALGLVGIWAFASTPIESVSYDSRTGTYRAQIALPGGVKFDIGTDWERVQNLSLRKRITKYWMLVTSYQPGTDENEGVGDVLIQREWIF